MRKISIFLIIVLLIQVVPATATADSNYTPQAEALKQLELFRGTGTGFELDRVATRAELAVMTVRLLGKEAQALKINPWHPFTDVPAWASPHVGFLFQTGITKGITDTLYGSNQNAESVHYATFVLRALGYSDDAGDFSWDKSLDKMVSLGILTSGQASTFSTRGLRGYVVAISHMSLFANLKGSDKTLLEKLYIQDQAVSYDQLKAASAIDSRISMFSNVFGVPKPYPAGNVLNAEEVFAKASSAVFKIEVKVFEDTDYGSGSGFFITSDGIAVTNYHVITEMSSANVITTDGRTYPVEGVLAIDYIADLAIIKVKGSNFPYLEVGDPAALRVAQRIYCIGSPYGLDNTISDGLVSNPDRVIDGYRYIQISAPIAPGSSGGALLNEYGQVVGVTTAGYDQGSVNLAVYITDLADMYRFPNKRTVKYLEAHSHFCAIPVPDTIYTRIESSSNKPVQTMEDYTSMYGTIKSASDVHYYALDVKSAAEMLISLTSNVSNSVGLKFEVSDPSGKVILKSRHYSGDIFSLATGYGPAEGLYTVRIYVDSKGEDWTNVDYELFWMYHEPYEVSGDYWQFTEFEPNDTPEYANYIPDFFDYVATISSKNDIDYYTFTLTARYQYVAFTMTDYEGSVLNAEVLDSNYKSVGKFVYDIEYGTDIFSAQLQAGTYYIKISAKSTSIDWDGDIYWLSGWYQS